MDLNIQLNRKMLALFYDEAMNELVARYRVARGGRGGSKSYGFGDMSIARACQERTDIAVCREYRSTIKGSVHKIICERIAYHNLGEAFDITDASITNRYTGSKYIYQHLHNNYTEVKGLEGTDICWIFEGHDLQEESWKVLNPTIRRTPRMKKDPEFWIEFNPQFEDDFIYRRFIVNPPPDAINTLINYTDNYWCPKDMKSEAQKCMLENPEEYSHIWLGNPRNIGGLVYPSFNMEHHLREVSMSRIEPIGNFFMGQDPHTTYYPACVWLGKVPRGDGSFDYYWYNEFPTRGMMGGKFYHEIRKEKKCTLTLRERAKAYRLMDNTTDRTYHGIKVMARGIDTRFAKGSGAGSTTTNTRGIIEEMADERNGGLIFETPPEHMIDVQRDRIRELLSWDILTPMHRMNEPRMYVMPHCENIIDTLRFHRFDKDGKDREDEKRKDFSDAMKITLALEQQRKYINKEDQEKPLPPEYDPIKDMAAVYLGEGAAIHAGSKTINTRITTPTAN